MKFFVISLLLCFFIAKSINASPAIPGSADTAQPQRLWLNASKITVSGDLLAAGVVQGLINRQGPYVSITRGDDSNSEYMFFHLLEAEQVSTTSYSNFTETTKQDLVKEGIRTGAVKARVLYNVDESHSVSTVIYLCSIHNAVPVTSEDDFSSLPIALDVRNRFGNELVATQYAYGLSKKHNFTKLGVAIQEPNLYLRAFLVDFVVKEKMFTFWLPSLCRRNSASNELATTILQSGRFDQPTQIWGYFPSAEVVAECTMTHDQISVVSDYLPNFSLYSHTPSNIAEWKQYTPDLTLQYNDSNIYIALVVSDGDNLQLDLHGIAPRFEKRRQICATKEVVVPYASCPKMSWTISNRLYEYAPHVLKYYYEAGRQSQVDSFLMGPSGWGFTHPGHMTRPAQQTLAKRTMEIAKTLDMSAYVHWDDYDDEEQMKDYIDLLANKTSPVKGVFSPIQPYVPDIVDDIETFEEVLRWFPGDNVFKIASNLAGQEPGTLKYMYKIFNVEYSEVEMLARILPDSVVLVDHRELIHLSNQKRKHESEKLVGQAVAFQ